MRLTSLDDELPLGSGALARRPMVHPGGHYGAGASVRSHARALPLRVGTRGSPLALWQTRHFLGLIRAVCPVLREVEAFEEHVIATSGDLIQDRRLADIGGKGLFAKEIHEALEEGRIDFAVHSLKDLETRLPDNIVLACTLKREDPRDALIAGPDCDAPSDADPWSAIPYGATVGTSSVRRQSQLLHARPDLKIATLRGNVATRLGKVRDNTVGASLLAYAGLKRLGLAKEAAVAISHDIMLPAACQGIVGITVRADDVELRELLGAIEDLHSRAVATAERALLHTLDGSCRTPIGGHATPLPQRRLRLDGLVAREDGTFLARRSLEGSASDAEALGHALGAELKALAPADIFLP